MFFRQEVIIMTTFDKILAGGIITIIRGLEPGLCGKRRWKQSIAGGLHPGRDHALTTDSRA